MFRRTDLVVPTSLRESELGRSVPESELNRVVQIGTSVHFRDGRAVMEEDAVGRECLMVVEGEFGVERDGHRIAELQVGEFAGEVALLNHQPRNATVTASAHSAAYVFNRREFASILSECPAVAAHVRLAAERRLVPA